MALLWRPFQNNPQSAPSQPKKKGKRIDVTQPKLSERPGWIDEVEGQPHLGITGLRRHVLDQIRQPQAEAEWGGLSWHAR